MAHNDGPHGQQVGAAAASDAGHSAPTTVAFSSLQTSDGAHGGGSSAEGNMETLDTGDGMGKKKDLLPDLNNMEDRDLGGIIIKEDKPRSVAEAETEEEEAAVEVPAADTEDDKGKSVAAAAADDGKHNFNIDKERERRKRMKGLFRELKDLMPHVPQKTDMATIVGEATEYIKLLEEKAAMLEKKKLEQAAARGEGSSTLYSETVQGMAALCSSELPRAGGGGVPVPPADAPAVPAPPARFKTWSGQNVVLTVANDNAYISVCVPRRPNTMTVVMSVLDNHGIDVITTEISANSDQALFMIYAHVNGTNDANRSSEKVYQRAVSEIIYRLNSSNNN